MRSLRRVSPTREAPHGGRHTPAQDIAHRQIRWKTIGTCRGLHPDEVCGFYVACLIPYTPTLQHAIEARLDFQTLEEMQAVGDIGVQPRYVNQQELQLLQGP